MKKSEWNLIWPIKADCHDLITLIWGSKTGSAYGWIHRNLNIRHFKDVNDYQTLFTARKALQAKALEEGVITLETLIEV